MYLWNATRELTEVSHPCPQTFRQPSEVYMWKSPCALSFRMWHASTLMRLVWASCGCDLLGKASLLSKSHSVSLAFNNCFSNEALYSTHLMKICVYLTPLEVCFILCKWEMDCLSECRRTTTPWPRCMTVLRLVPSLCSGQPPPPSHTLGPLNEPWSALLRQHRYNEQDWPSGNGLLLDALLHLSILISSICLV